jgi:hypothetical protein
MVYFQTAIQSIRYFCRGDRGLFDEVEGEQFVLQYYQGYKTGICVTIQAVKGQNFAEHGVIMGLLRAMGNVIPKKLPRIPDWDLRVVLRALRNPPFEPMTTTLLHYMTMETAFLTAWASAAKILEIHALTVAKGHFKLDSLNIHLDLFPESTFLAKNQVAVDPPRRLGSRP